MKYLIIFLFVISCSSQQSKNVFENHNDSVFTTSDWKKLIIQELEEQQQQRSGNEKQPDLVEDIKFINSKGNFFLEKKFLYSKFKNKKLNENSFFLISYFSEGEGHYEYTYILEKVNNCHSYLISDNGFDQKYKTKKINNCEQKLDKINSLMNYSQHDKFTPVKGLLILWSVVEGKNKVKVFHNLTSSQDDLIENIFYESH